MCEEALLPERLRPPAHHLVGEDLALQPAGVVVPPHADLSTLVPRRANLVCEDVEHPAVHGALRELPLQAFATKVVRGSVGRDAFEAEVLGVPVDFLAELQHDVDVLLLLLAVIQR